MFVLGSPGADKYPCHPFRVPAQAPRRLTQHPQAPGAGALQDLPLGEGARLG